MLLKPFSFTSKPTTITAHPEKPFGQQYIAEQQTTQNASQIQERAQGAFAFDVSLPSPFLPLAKFL